MIDNPPQAFQEQICRARKLHRCYECQTEIQPGTFYHYASGVWDGRPDSFRTCLECNGLRQYLTDGYTFGGLHEEISYLIEEGWRPPDGAVVPAWVAEKVAEWADEDGAYRAARTSST